MQRRPSMTSIVRIASVAAAILTLGGAANDAEAQRSTGCVKRLVVSHVPGRPDKIWVIRCIPTHTTTNRY
jgi:hypothetical protein